VPESKLEHSGDVERCGCRPRLNLPVFLLVVGLSAVLYFWGLGTRTLWEDEGETAVLARSVLSCGIPKALSGNNLVCQGGLTYYDKSYRWTFHPWGQFYVAAAGLAIFGNTTFAARFPFALCGVLTVAMLYVFVWRHWRSSSLAALSALLLAASVNFILHCRQCRYYGLSALTTLIVVTIFIEVINNPSRRWWIGLGAALAAQFYADFGTLMVMLPGLLLSFWPIRAGKKEVIAAAKGFALAFLLVIPGLVLHWERLTAAGKGSHNFFGTLQILLVHICYFDAWFIPLLFVIPAAGVFIWRFFSGKKIYVTEQGRIITVCTLVIVSAAVGMTWAAPQPHLRFLIPLMSLAKLLLVLIVAGFYNILRTRYLPLWSAKMLFAVIVIMLAFTNFFSIPINYFVNKDKHPIFRLHPPQSEPFAKAEFAGLVCELTQDFVCDNRVALNVVNDLAEAGETVFINYGDLPLMFYRPDLKIYSPATRQYMHTPPDVAVSSDNGSFSLDAEAMKANYNLIVISVPNVVFGNIPEPRAHYFVTPSAKVPFRIYIRSDHKERLRKLPHTIETLEARWYRPR
jgi:4-amino-4-deoxy-L-arabinose transferase-like glycosyltransferase